MPTKTVNEQQAFQKLAALCARGEHCQHDMLEKLRQWDVDEESQARIMERLLKERYVDDERYSRAFVHDKIAYNKWGRRKIEQALWQKRVDKGIVRMVLDEIADEDYVSILKPLLRQKSKHMTGRNDYERSMKLMRWAMSRGFTMEVIRQCMEVEDGDAW